MQPFAAAAPRRFPVWLAALFALGPAVGALTLQNAAFAAVLVDEGARTALLLASAAGWGAWPTRALLGRRTLGQWLCVATALGLGVLAVFTLAAGVCGALTSPLVWIVTLAGVAAGGGFLWRHAAELRPTAAPPPLWSALVLAVLLAVPLYVALYGACLPPGVLWGDDGRGYDVLEYHLAAPRAYFEAGRIQLLPDNVYASFPQQMEMLYLLLMHLMGSALGGAIPAQLLHAACGALAVLTVAAWTPAGWPRRLAVLLAGTAPWLAYLGALAYVELGVLYFAAVAGALLLEQVAALHPARRPLVAAGLCLGAAAGCKYTALVLVGAALLLAWCAAARAPLGGRLRAALICAGAALAAFSPWVVRNLAFTGNPVHPFAYELFGGRGWSAAQAAQWTAGHQPAPADRGFVGRTRGVFVEVLGALRFGPWLFALGLLGALFARSRAAALLGGWVLLGLLGWAVFTHQPGRFATFLVAPAALLVGVGAAAAARRPGRARAVPGLVTFALLGAAANGAILLQQLAAETRYWARFGVALADLAGQTAAFATNYPLRRALPADGRGWVVGDARAFYLPPEAHCTVVFNRDPWLEFAAAAPPAAALDWLRTQKVTHVVFCWTEIDRLRATYGFPAGVTPAWVATLVQAGLRPSALPDGVRREDLDVYEVPRAPQPEAPPPSSGPDKGAA